ncbi:hypothetical protein D9M73_197410 [compost metagenome]
MRQPYAAVDRAVTQCAAFGFTQNDGAGPAIAFAAAFLGAGKPQVLAQHLQKGACGWYIAQSYNFAPTDESNGFDSVLLN